MPPIPPQQVQLACPNCRNPINAQIYTVVDVTQQPELKPAFLNGRLNLAACANCGFASLISAPIVYHDADKQLCLSYFPAEANARPEEQERFIGDATNVIGQNLAPDRPRGHLLTPRRFMSLVSLIDAILEADGISPEEVKKQRKTIELISILAAQLENEEQFNALVEQHKAELDETFFALLDAFIETSAQEQHADSVQMLTGLRQKITAALGLGDEPGALTNDQVEQAIDRLLEAEDSELEALVREMRETIDYTFFQAWTTRIEKLEQEGQSEEATRMVGRRARILETVEKFDREIQELFEIGAGVLREILSAPDPRAALEERVKQLDDAFMFVLSANIANAERANQHDIAARLQDIQQAAVEVIQNSLSPEERFINELLMAETQKESTALLRKNFAKITPDFVKQLNELADEQEKRGTQEAADRLRQLAREAGAMLF